MAILKVKTNSGWVEGLPSSNQAVSVFKGIPFAQPPVGELRWKLPVPVKPWEGVYEAYKYADIAWQERISSEGGSVAGSEFYVLDHPRNEDCLYLNVFTPAKSADEKLPVAVYIHGGGYRTGYSYLNCYDGDGFAKRGIVYVSIAYRINVFGFLAHPELRKENQFNSTGNYGALDQVLALKWVKDNIAAFGGNPDMITVFGQSAGGGSTQTMCATHLTKGIFKRAIMQSGGGLWQPGAVRAIPIEEAEKQGEDFIKFLGVKNVSEARSIPAEKVFDAYVRFNKEQYPLHVSPIADGYLLSADQTDIFRSNDYEDRDYMVGCTKDEGGARGSVPDYAKRKALAERFYGKYAELYLKTVNADDEKAYERDVFKVGMADEMKAGCLAWCELQLELGRKPSYMYYFTHVPPGAEAVGAHHSVEHHYVFQTMHRSNRPYTGWDWDLSNTLATFWANFIKTGNPNGDGLPEWEPYTKGSPKAFVIDKDLKMKYIEENTNVAFMKNFLLKRL